MKTILLTVLLTGLSCWAQSSRAPANPGTFAPLPAPDTNHNPQLEQALHDALSGRTNQVVQPAPAPSTNAPVSTTVVVPTAPVVVPTAPAPSTPATVPSASPTPNVITVPGPGVPAGQPRPPADLKATAIPPGGETNVSADETLPAGTINFPATDLNQVLQIYAELVGRTVLRPTALPAPTITLKTQTPLTRHEAIQAFDAVLALNGIATVNVGDKFVKVVPMAQAGQVGAPFSKEKIEQLPEMGQFVTDVIQVTNAKPSELVAVLTPFASAGLAGGILPIDGSGILVLRDYSENVKRMLEMVKKIDVALPSEFTSEVIPIKYALAADIANALNSLSTGGGATTVGTSSTTGAAGFGARGTTGGFGRGSTTGFNRPGIGGYGSGYPGSMGGLGTTPYGTTQPGATAQPGAAGSFSDRLQRIINRASVSGEIQVLGQTKIIADERTNSLLIYASRDDMKTIKDIVSKLDVVLAQVLIEAVIVEVSLNNSAALGISYLENKPHGFGNSYIGQGAVNNNSFVTPGSFNLISGVATNAAGTLPSGFSYLASLGNNDLDVSVTALAANGNARILQRPRIQTSHAVPATLFVGESRPYPQGSYYGGGAFGGYSTIQQLQIGVSLEVTPLINPDGLVVMDIHQKIDSFKGNVTIQGVGDVPITSSKDATAKVAVRDRDTIILGGLIETSKNSNFSGVPLLKDIPILGYLFRSSEKDETRSELIVLIRPTVLPTPEVAALTAKAEKDKMPEVRRMETEVQTEENARLRKMRNDLGHDK